VRYSRWLNEKTGLQQAANRFSLTAAAALVANARQAMLPRGLLS